MSRQAFRTLTVVVAVVLVLAGLELGLNLVGGAAGCVEVVNEGREPIESIVATTSAGREEVGRVPPGESVRFYLGSKGDEPLLLTFHQRGNAMGTYSLPGYNASYLRRDSMKLVLKIRPGEVERYQDDEPPRTPLGGIVHGVRDWVSWFYDYGDD
ncbi:MAG: hypothetical protein U0835_02575 [Isosphaeraceae bacterium]